MFFDFDSLEASEGVPPLLVEEGWTTVESEPAFELRCSGCKLPVRMLPELFEDCHRCGAPCCCYCVTKPDDSQWTTPALCKRCAVWQRLPKGEREGAREAAEVARRLCGLSITEIRARALVVTDDDSTDVRAARALAEQLTLLARCPRHCGEAERELIWRFHEELLEGPDAAHWLLLLVEEFLEPRARALVRVRLLTEEHLEALQQVLSSDLRVTQQMVASGAEGRDVLLCPGDQLNSDAGVLHDIGGTSGKDNLQYMVRRLPLDLDFRRDTVATIAHWAMKVRLSAQHVLRALAALSRSSDWPAEVTVPLAGSVAETLADSTSVSNEMLVAFSASIVVWLARAPADVVAPIAQRLVQRAANDETVLNSLYWAARQHEPSSPAIKGHAARRLGGFKEDLLRAAPSPEAQRLHDARTFYDELAEHDPGEAPLRVNGPFRCAPCFQNLVVDVLDEPVKRFQSKTAPVCFGLRVQNPDGSEGVQHLIRKKEDDMLKQQQVSAIVAQMATALLSDARVREHLTSLGLNPATFFAGHHHIQTIFPGIGIIEVVPHAHTLSKVRPVLDFLWRCRRSRDQPMQKLARAYGVSSAFWFAMSFLLGLGDRHGDNVMVTEDGTFFHIDFGFILGKDTMLFRHVAGPARVDFKEIKSVVGDDTPRAFFETLRLAFNVLRSGAHLLFEQLSLAAELDDDGLLPLGQARARVRAFVEQRCQPGAGDLDAGDKIERIVRRCADAPTDWIRDATHGLAMRQPQVVIHGAVSKLAQHGAVLASDATDVALEGLDAACSVLDNFCGQRWERAALCSVCNRPVARRFVKWSRRERRHHCRVCRKTVCDRRECSATPNGKERRCRNCALSATAPEAVTVGSQAACTGTLPLLGPGAPGLPEGANWPREPIVLGLPTACSFTEEQHTRDYDIIQLNDEPPPGS